AFECRWAESPVSLDGVPDKGAWKDAAVIDRFSLPWLGKGARPARTATRARLLWDRENLYFSAEMEDADLTADAAGHEAWDEDACGLFLKPADDKPGFYEFRVNAAGSVAGRFLPGRGAAGALRFPKDGEFRTGAKVRLQGTLNRRQGRDAGWSVTGRV